MFIELPVIYKENDDAEENTDLLVIDINEIHSFNPSSREGETCLRVHAREESWQINMPYEDFKEMFELVKGEIKSFIKTGIEI